MCLYAHILYVHIRKGFIGRGQGNRIEKARLRPFLGCPRRVCGDTIRSRAPVTEQTLVRAAPLSQPSTLPCLHPDTLSFRFPHQKRTLPVTLAARHTNSMIAEISGQFLSL